jgi:hypothetical protein
MKNGNRKYDSPVFNKVNGYNFLGTGGLYFAMAASSAT